MSCDFVVDARIVSFDGSTVLASMQDPANGLKIVGEIDEPEWNESQVRVTAVYMNGSAPASVPTITDGELPVTVLVSGDTVAQMRQRMAALRTAWRAEDRFYLAVEFEDVTITYLAERLAWQPGRISSTSLLRKKQEVTLVFRVQPNPTEVYA